MHQICESYLRGDINESRDQMLHYLDLMDGLFADVNPIPVKEALNQMGWKAGPCRMPLVSMSDSAKAALTALLKRYQII
jgi:4-hydroxy-tetrahydrodipicolinate synthase